MGLVFQQGNNLLVFVRWSVCAVYSKLVNTDVLISPLARSSAAFFTLWQHYFAPYLPLYGHASPEENGKEDGSLVLTGEEPICSFRVEPATNSRGKTTFAFPLSLPRRQSPVQYFVRKTAASAPNALTLAAEAILERKDAPEERQAYRQPQQQQEQYTSGTHGFEISKDASLHSVSVVSRVRQLCADRGLGSLSTTLVSGLWKVPPPALAPVKTTKVYMEQFRLGLKLFVHQGMIMFADSHYMPLIEQAVQDAAAADEAALQDSSAPRLPVLSRVCLVPLELEELPYAFMATHVRLAGSAAIRDPRVDVGWWNHPFYNEMYYVVQASKIALATDVSLADPFSSQFFFWVDPPKREYYPTTTEEIDRALDGVFLSKNVKKGALLMQSTPPRILPGPWATACHAGVFASHAEYSPGVVGGIIGGTRDAFER